MRPGGRRSRGLPRPKKGASPPVSEHRVAGSSLQPAVTVSESPGPPHRTRPRPHSRPWGWSRGQWHRLLCSTVSGLISSAVGSFDSVTPATITETGPWWAGGLPPPPPAQHATIVPHAASSDTTQISNALMLPTHNAFTLQLNTKPFPTIVVPRHAVDVARQGWQQLSSARTNVRVALVYSSSIGSSTTDQRAQAPPSSCASRGCQRGQ